MKKTILITGSTDGIGKLTAIKLAKDGHKIYLHGRNGSKLQNVIEEVKSESGNNAVEGFVADLSDLSAVNSLIDNVNEKITGLDVLINNAGIYKSSHPITKQGFDVRFMVNYLSPYLLTNKLLPLLKKGKSPRIINLSSAAQSPVSLKSLNGEGALSDQNAYAQSKLALTMWTMYLADQEKEITAIAVNPGSLLNTKMVKEAFGNHWSSANKGRDILYDLAVSEEYQNSSGKYFDNDKGDPKGMFSQAHADAYDVAKIEELIAKTNSIVGVSNNA